MADDRENPSRPIVGVGAVIIQGDEVLLIKRAKAPSKGDWSLPGGAIEIGETAKAALVREVKEETGLDVSIGDVIDAVDFINTMPDGHHQFHYILIDYLAFPTGGTLQAGSDAEDARFYSFEKALTMVRWSETKRIIEKARSQLENN